MRLLALLDPCVLPGEQVQHGLLEAEKPRGEKEVVPTEAALDQPILS